MSLYGNDIIIYSEINIYDTCIYSYDYTCELIAVSTCIRPQVHITLHGEADSFYCIDRRDSVFAITSYVGHFLLPYCHIPRGRAIMSHYTVYIQIYMYISLTRNRYIITHIYI